MTHPVNAYNHAEYVRSLEARLAEAEHVIDKARRVMRGEGVEDQGEAWDKCLRLLDGYRAADSASPALDLNAPFDAPIRAQQARDAATYAEGLQRQREYMASDEFKRLVRAAYIQGATDVHENRQEDRCPDFNEAADDYAATVTVSAGQEGKP